MQGPNLSDYDYVLPDDRIAQFPLDKRDDSKLLVFKNEFIGHHHFYNLPEHLPADALLVFNDTRVIPARLFFHKNTGAQIEIMLLEPMDCDTAVQMGKIGSANWNALIGNLKKWKDGQPLQIQLEKGVTLSAEIISRLKSTIRLSWSPPDKTMAEILDLAGKLPLPPYIHREPESNDAERYQTVYAKIAGAVAAPTAGLHFTSEVFEKLESKGVQLSEVTLHVGAGTFQPVKETINVALHEMHSEEIIVKTDEIKRWAEHSRPIVAVGTTSLRTLESCYWYAVQLMENPETRFEIPKLLPYSYDNNLLPSKQEAFNFLYTKLKQKSESYLQGHSAIFIFPGYKFKVVDALITNFHMPKTTLILLIAAFAGQKWHDIYNEALKNQYRFLSYGDSSVIFRPE